MIKVDIAVACTPAQSSLWWSRVWNMLLYSEKNGIQINKIHAVTSALVDTDKNKVVKIPVLDELAKRRNELTDSNRVSATDEFMDGGAEWVFWMDDDTVPPVNAIAKLLESGRDFIAGVYFNTNPPHLPIAYMRQPYGMYFPVTYVPGGVKQVDSVGMGCTLIHRSVYERIKDAYKLVQLPNGVLYPVLKSEVKDKKYAKESAKRYVRGGYLHIPITEVGDDDNRHWPFYALEHGRTEDHWFCELADAIGIKPYVDFDIRCEHVKLKPTTIDEYERWQADHG